MLFYLLKYYKITDSKAWVSNIHLLVLKNVFIMLKKKPNIKQIKKFFQT